MMSRQERTNRLIDETSPYLLQHAHNPVDWYPWGEEAFEKAREGDKPILLSIGYSACHWCHVMEEESFEDEETACLMNENFVNIKVDREERPDVDSIYMDAVQAMTGSGGWPMTVFLTPEGEPFYGGTYYPPEPRHGLPGFSQVLQGVAQAFHGRPDEVERVAKQLVDRLQATQQLQAGETLSGGERKRIELAAAYAMRPRLAILDEPDSGIDVLSLDDIARLVRRMADEGTTVVLITHRDEMAAMADRASLMCGGTIVATGMPDEVRSYFETRCRPHGELLGPQPWGVVTGQEKGL